MRRLFYIALISAGLNPSFASEAGQAREENNQFVGAIGCRSSSCHGGAGEKRSQYITWSQKDFHTRGFAILLDARSARIGEGVGISAPQTSARCTVCHSPFAAVPAERLGPNAHPDEGVSCENCHGAAGGWLRGHTRPDWSYANRVSAGMHDLRNLYVRASACAACHQTLDADIFKAGHPALVFELDEQSTNEPRHWREDDPESGPHSWLVGQAVALRESAWRARTDGNSSIDAQETAKALSWLLARITQTDASLPSIIEPASSDLEPLQKEADELARRAADWKVTKEGLMTILRSLGDGSGEFSTTPDRSRDELLYRAIRITLALDRLGLAAGLAPEATKQVALMRTDVQRRYDFDVAAFAEHLRTFREKL